MLLDSKACGAGRAPPQTQAEATDSKPSPCARRATAYRLPARPTATLRAHGMARKPGQRIGRRRPSAAAPAGQRKRHGLTPAQGSSEIHQTNKQRPQAGAVRPRSRCGRAAAAGAGCRRTYRLPVPAHTSAVSTGLGIGECRSVAGSVLR